jgi:hypothetical protein
VLLPAAELAGEYATPGQTPGQLEWSASVAQLLSFAIPEADRPRGADLWGTDEQWFWASLFIGTATVILAGAGVSRRRARPLLLVAAVCALLSLGHNLGLSAWVLQWPGLRSFRYPAKYAIGAMFAVSMLAGVGLQRIQASGRRWWPYGGFVVGVAVGLVLASRLHQVREGFALGAPWALFISALLVATMLGLRRRGVPWLIAFEALLAPGSLCS